VNKFTIYVARKSKRMRVLVDSKQQAVVSVLFETGILFVFMWPVWRLLFLYMYARVSVYTCSFWWVHKCVCTCGRASLGTMICTWIHVHVKTFLLLHTIYLGFKLIHTMFRRKHGHLIFVRNFAKCWSILKKFYCEI